jgi:hypothetical protein
VNRKKIRTEARFKPRLVKSKLKSSVTNKPAATSIAERITIVNKETTTYLRIRCQRVFEPKNLISTEPRKKDNKVLRISRYRLRL